MKHFVLFAFLLSVVAFYSSASADTLAYWRFDDAGDADIEQWGPVAAGNPLPDSDGWTVWRKAAQDHSGNGNHLTTWEYAWAGFTWSADVPFSAVPLSGAANALSMATAGNYPSAMTWSAQSLPSGTDIETATPAAFTIEASFKANVLAGYQTIVGRDDRYVATSNGDLAALYFQVMPNRDVAIKFADVSGYWHEAISAVDAVQEGLWYSMTGVSDGSTLKLYLDNELVAQTDMTASGSPNTAMAKGSSSGGDWVSGTWTVGRGMYAGGHGDRWNGLIDEVRISDTALAPSEFLSIPEPSSMILLVLVSLVSLFLCYKR
ncbi:MAG: LamG domain-containing protein [Pirellulales bacterium]|nr:LamG domain-containing protein [Pirellulales bacterium]